MPNSEFDTIGNSAIIRHDRELEQAASVAEHDQLIDLLRDGHTEQAIALVEAHVTSVEQRALAWRPASDNLDVLDVLRRY